MPSQYTSALEVSFSVDNTLKSLKVETDNGTKIQTIDSFGETNGFGGLTTLTVMGLKGNTTMTFTTFNNDRSPHGFLVQFGATYPHYLSTGISKLSSDTSRDAAWKVTYLPQVSNSGYDGIPLNAGENAYIYDGKSGYGFWKPLSSASSGWIGVTKNLMDARPPGKYVYETTFIMPSQYKSLVVGFSADDKLTSVTVETDNGATTKTYDETTFSGNGFAQLNTLTVTGLKGTTKMIFTADNGTRSPHGLLVQFGDAF